MKNEKNIKALTDRREVKKLIAWAKREVQEFVKFIKMLEAELNKHGK